jgi:hypothetical protein
MSSENFNCTHDPDTGCWVWQGRLYRGRAPHKRVYVALVGPIPSRHDLHHICRNIQCVNPAHLELMTVSAHRTMHAREGSVLSVEDVTALRQSTETSVELAEVYPGATVYQIADIRAGKSWLGVGPNRPEVYCGACGALITDGYRNKRYCNSAHRQQAYMQRRGTDG